MNDPGVYLEKLSAFSRLLHLEGLPVSPQDTADASRILICLGLEDRQRVKTALRTVYAKSREEQLVFDRVFDGFFLSEEAMRRQARECQEREAQAREARREAEEHFRGSGPILDGEELEAYGAMPEEERQRLLQFADRYRDSARRNPKLYGSFIRSVFAKALLEQQLRMEDAGTGGESADPELGIAYRDIAQFKDTEIPRAISMIQKLSRQLNGELSARNRRTGRSAQLDFRRTIRKGLETGGSFYRLKYKKKPGRRRQLTVLCDVSGSMMQFSEFVLRFIQSLNQVSESSRVFLFSEGIYEADAFSLQNMSRFREYVAASGLYGRGTDLGTALETLCALRPAALSGGTTLLILSDAKTIDQPRAVAALREAQRQAGRVLWLNPIPERHWKHLRSVQTFQSLCPMLSCNTLSALAAACRKLH